MSIRGQGSNYRPRNVTECAFLNSRTLTYCLHPSHFVIPYGRTGIGACRAHIQPVVLFAVNGAERRVVTVVPIERWDDYQLDTA